MLMPPFRYFRLSTLRADGHYFFSLRRSLYFVSMPPLLRLLFSALDAAALAMRWRIKMTKEAALASTMQRGGYLYLC